MHLNIEVWTNNFRAKKAELVACGEFVFVAIDEQGKPKPIVQT